jgi:hypothetical protein
MNGWIDVTGAPRSDADHAWEWGNGQRALIHAPLSIPTRVYDATGSPIPTGTAAFGAALRDAQTEQHKLEDEDFQRRVDPGSYDGEAPPHSGAFPVAEYGS